MVAAIDVEATYARAVACHGAGDLAAAALLYQRIIAEARHHGGAWLNYGVLLKQADRIDEAERGIRVALCLDPANPVGYTNLGTVEKGFPGRQAAAVAHCRRALLLAPGLAEAAINLGAALERDGRGDEANAAYRRAAAMRPDLAEPWSNLANLALTEGDAAKAAALAGRALALRPLHADARRTQAAALLKAGDRGAAAAAHAACAAFPADADACNGMGNVLRAAGDFAAAARWYRRAVACRPHYAEVRMNLATSQADDGDVAAAIDNYRQALALDPALAEAWQALAPLLPKSRDAEAVAASERAYRLRSGDSEARLAAGMALLARGRFETGFRLYEARQFHRDLAGMLVPGPAWDGRPLHGDTLLVQGEQGVGDVLQFVRYLAQPQLAGGRVVLRVAPPLLPLLRQSRLAAEIVSTDDPAPAFDWQLPLLSLPRLFGTSAATIPARLPYLTVPEARVAAWRRRLAPAGRRLRVGLVWAGNPEYVNDRRRSVPLETLAPLLAVPGVAAYSLQKGAAASQLEAFGDRIVDLGSELDDWAETAAAISALDLLICVDTGLAHLGGALARPVWLMLPHVADWRWQIERSDSPWYPTHRLFRQAVPGDWPSVVRQMAVQLEMRARLQRKPGLNRLR